MPSLPFLDTCDISSNGIAVLADCPVSVWPAPNRVTDVGAAYDHQAEAPYSAYEALRSPNAKVVIAGTTYQVIDLQANAYLPHVSMQLREMRAMI